MANFNMQALKTRVNCSVKNIRIKSNDPATLEKIDEEDAKEATALIGRLQNMIEDIHNLNTQACNNNQNIIDNRPQYNDGSNMHYLSITPEYINSDSSNMPQFRVNTIDTNYSTTHNNAHITNHSCTSHNTNHNFNHNNANSSSNNHGNGSNRLVTLDKLKNLIGDLHVANEQLVGNELKSRVETTQEFSIKNNKVMTSHIHQKISLENISLRPSNEKLSIKDPSKRCQINEVHERDPKSAFQLSNLSKAIELKKKINTPKFSLVLFE